ncbi:MAG: hypothetical protein PUC44_02015 [Eubacteriales bacterium]|nr:hypothetical protein [Eubacteriales bacterium]
MLKIKKRRILVLVAVLAVIACFGAGSVFAGSTAYTIEYSSNNIHSVKMEDGSEIVLFCMNNQRHWPHTTPAISSVPQYEETSIQEFCRENGLTDSTAIAAFTNRLKTILYAGYPYNGMSLYQLKSGVTAVSEEQFDEILNPPQSIRDDFSDTIGSRTFSLDDFRNQTENMNALREFTQQVYELYLTGGTTKSGLTYSDITATPFYGAVWCMFNSSDPLTAYSAIYQTGYFLTEEQAYSATSNAVWNLMKEYGIPDNSGVQDSTALSRSLKVAQSTGVLTEKPSASNVSIEGDAVFRQNESDGKWYTGTLNLKAPSTYREGFSLSLPSGISVADGSSDVKPGGSFVLVSDEKPADGVSISLSASIPWMEGDILVFQAIGDDSHEFQNMVGARIHTENITVSKSLSTEKKEDEDTDNPDNPNKPDNPNTPNNPSGSKDSAGSTDSKDSTGSSNQAASEKGGSKTAEAKTGSNAVNTGDTANLALYCAAAVGAAALMTVLVRVRRKKNSDVK